MQIGGSGAIFGDLPFNLEADDFNQETSLFCSEASVLLPSKSNFARSDYRFVSPSLGLLGALADVASMVLDFR